MSRNLIQHSFVFHSLVQSNRLSPLYHWLPSHSFRTVISSQITAEPSLSSLFTAAIYSASQSSILIAFHQYAWALCSVSGSSNMALIKSEKEFNDVLSKVQGKSLPAIFYFTIVWCGPYFYVALERAGYCVGHRQRCKSCVGIQHRVTKENAMKWFQVKFEGVILNKAQTIVG